jgi:hypothetical protein
MFVTERELRVNPGFVAARVLTVPRAAQVQRDQPMHDVRVTVG